MTDFLKAWSVTEKDFPHEGSPAEKLAYCLRYAILAPSSYNTQPWFFRVEDNTVRVYADRRYALPVIDPDDRELILACAAALYNLRIAIRAFGYTETTELLPEESNPDLLARVKLGEKAAQIDENDRLLFKSINKRHLNYGTFSDRPIPDESLEALTAAAKQERAWLHVCTEAERKIILRLVAEADQIQNANKHFRRELAAWADKRRSISGEGLPYLGLSYSEIMNGFSPTVARRFRNDDDKPANDEELSEGSPTIIVLGTKTGVDIERIYAGQAMMRVLLQAECEGLAVSMLNQPCEVPELRLVLHDELNQQGRAHMILRIGYGAKPAFGPRRPLSACLEAEGKLAASLDPSIVMPKAAKKPVFGKFGNLFLAKKRK